MVNTEKFQSKINAHYPNEHLKVLSYSGARSQCRIQCETCGRVYEYKNSGSLLSKKKKILCHDCMDKILKKERFLESLKRRYPEDDLIVESFISRQRPCEIICCNCGEHFYFEKAEYVFHKTRSYFCTKCFPAKQEIMEATLNQFKKFIDSSKDWELLQSLNNVHSHDLISCKCAYCGKENKKTVYDYLRGKGCLCQSGTEQKTTEEFAAELDDDYELLSPYKNAYSKVLIRHKVCGFIYSVTPHNYLSGKRCPKCSRKESKGEKAIARILQSQNIDFIKEYPVAINGHKLRFDFYLPGYDKFIEYQGEQHYHPVSYFGGESRFALQVQYDTYKRQYAKDRMIVISYQDDILSVLMNSLKFNDYPLVGVEGDTSK